MNNRIIEIVSYIVRNMFVDNIVPEAEQKIVERLLEKGYDLNEIDSAFDWISQVLKFGIRKDKHQKFLRPFTRIEEFKLNDKAKDLIRQLFKYKYLDMEEFELVMAAVDVYDSNEVDESVLNRIIDQVLKHGDNSNDKNMSIFSSDFFKIKEH